MLVTIEDYALNVDPTSKDTWWMHDPGDPTYGRYGIDGPQAFGQALVDRQKAINDAFVRFDDPHHRNDQRLHNAIAEANNDPDKIRLAQIEYARIDNTLHANYFAAYRAAIQAFNAEISRIAIEFAEPRSVPGFGKFDIVGNSQLVCSNKLTECIVVRAPGEDHGKNWVWFMEEGRNESTFTNTNNNGETTALASPDFYAKRGGQFSFEYDDNRVYAILTYETSDIDIDTDDMWSSGQEVGIMLLDSDMNLSSLNEDQLSSIDRRYVIPTIRIGEPFTLAESKEIMMKDNDGSGNSAIIHHYRVIENSDAVVFEYINDYTAGDQLVIELGGWSNFKKYLPQHISP